MGVATLLNAASPFWFFENQQAHLQAPNNGYGVLDPGERPDGEWRMDHSTSHDDMLTPPQAAQDFYDIDYSNPAAAAWWTWTHHQDHYLSQLMQAQTLASSRP